MMVMMTDCSSPSLGVPYSHTSIHTPADDPHPIVCNRINLMKMPTEDVYALARVDVPQPTRRVVAPTNDFITANVHRTHALLVPLEHAQ